MEDSTLRPPPSYHLSMIGQFFQAFPPLFYISGHLAGGKEGGPHFSPLFSSSLQPLHVPLTGRGIEGIIFRFPLFYQIFSFLVGGETRNGREELQSLLFFLLLSSDGGRLPIFSPFSKDHSL